MRLTKALTAVLAVLYATVVDAGDACLSSATCKSGATRINFTNCGLQDADIVGIQKCFDTVGRGTIVELFLQGNPLTMLPSEFFQDFTALTTLWIINNQLTTITASVLSPLGSLGNLQLLGNPLTAIEAGAFDALTNVVAMDIVSNRGSLTTLPDNLFANMASLTRLSLANNQLTALPDGLFTGLSALKDLNLHGNTLETIPAALFQPLTSIEKLSINKMGLTTIEAGTFDNLGTVENLDLEGNELTTLPPNLFADMANAHTVDLGSNSLTKLPVHAFVGLSGLQLLYLSNNELTTLPAGVFDDLGSDSILRSLHLNGNNDLQCVPTITQSLEWSTTYYSSYFIDPLPTTAGLCGCTPEAAISCGTGEVCSPRADGFTCDDPAEAPIRDPHMTGFGGQKFDFVGEDDGWYSLVSDLPFMHLNMRITSPVPSVPEITYITGISIITTDANGLDHSIVVAVADPHSLESSCPVRMPTCLADGALHVVVNGEEVLLAPGELTLGPDVAISAVNLPGACRSFGFEEYWERKKLDLAQAGRQLSLENTMQDMSDWVLSDPTATNVAECAEYVRRATTVGGPGLFAHQSEHVSFQIMTPAGTVRLSHGRLHQLAMRDPTGQFDLPDHKTWQMNIAIDNNQVSLDAAGILGETLVPTVNNNGDPIMQGMESIRGGQEDYRVEGPVGVVVAQGRRDQ